MDSSSVLDPTVDIQRSYFRFFDLPTELRLKVLGINLLTDHTIDLDPVNYRGASQRLHLFLTSSQFHEEAYKVFYGGNTFRIFPVHGRFFGNKVQPLLSRLSSRYRNALQSLELRLGPGWSKPPKSWQVNNKLGLEDATSVRTMKVFVDVDPSNDTFKGFRVAKEFYTDFSGILLREIIHCMPKLERIEFDGYPSVLRQGSLILRLVKEAEKGGKRIAWSARRSWDDDAIGLVGRFKYLGFNDEMLARHGRVSNNRTE